MLGDRSNVRLPGTSWNIRRTQAGMAHGGEVIAALARKLAGTAVVPTEH